MRGAHAAASSTRRGQEFKHALPVLGKHFGQVARHRIRPKEIVVECSVGVYSLGRVQRQQLVQQITSIGVLHVRLKAICNRRKCIFYLAEL